MANIYLGLGSNHEPKSDNIRRAEQYISQYIGTIHHQSSDYVTEPWGKKDQDAFINNIVVVESYLNPAKILSAIEKIEFVMGRQRVVKWGDRIIDIDILFIDQKIVNTVKLTVPHPCIQERNFVLAPMKEINHSFLHPILQKTIEELYLSSSDQSAVRIIAK